MQDILSTDYNVAVEDIGTKLIAIEDTIAADTLVSNAVVVDPAIVGNNTDTISTEEDVPGLEAPSRAVTTVCTSSNNKGKSPVGRLMGFTPWKAVKGFGAAGKNVHWRSSLVL